PASTAATRSSRSADAGSQAADADAQSDADTTGPRASDLIDGLGSRHTPTSGGSTMIVMLSARRLKQGAWEQFRRAWEPGDAMPPGFQRAYHARNIRDEDEVVSFGLFDMSEDDYRSWRADADAEETQRVDRLSAFVENEHVAGVYEVIDVVDE